MSLGVLNDVSSMMKNGRKNAAQIAISTTCRPSWRKRRRVRTARRGPGRCRLGWSAAVVVVLVARLIAVSLLVVDPAARGPQDDRGQGQRDQEQHPGQRGGVPHLEVDERILEQVHAVGQQ